MTEVLTVPTHFDDLSALSTGLVDRVSEGSLILYGPVEYATGDEVNFRILLADETTAFEGVGRVGEVYDGGDERDPETRYDIVFDGLQLDGRNEVIYERILLAGQSITDDDPATGEVDIPGFEADPEAAEVLDFDDATEFAQAADYADAEPASEAYVDGEAGFADVSVDGADYEAVADEASIDGFEEIAELVDPAADSAPPQMATSASSGPLGRPVFASNWWPEAKEPEPRASTGWFQYNAGDLPVPQTPPRPELAADQRVTAAPRPDSNASPEPSAPREIDLPSHDAEIAPAVESDYVSVGDIQPVDGDVELSSVAEEASLAASPEEVAVTGVDEGHLEIGDESPFKDVDQALAESAADAEDEFSFAGVAESVDEAVAELEAGSFGADEAITDLSLEEGDDTFDMDFDDDAVNA